eukprot:12637581-Heterocapsa_arctica.AAC.1
MAWSVGRAILGLPALQPGTLRLVVCSPGVSWSSINAIDSLLVSPWTAMSTCVVLFGLASVSTG